LSSCHKALQSTTLTSSLISFRTPKFRQTSVD
jgi:hypothetical protein